MLLLKLLWLLTRACALVMVGMGMLMLEASRWSQSAALYAVLFLSIAAGLWWAANKSTV